MFYLIQEIGINNKIEFNSKIKISEIVNYTIYGYKKNFLAIDSQASQIEELDDDEIDNISVVHSDYDKLVGILVKFTHINDNSKSEYPLYGKLIKTYRKYLVIVFEEVFYGIPLNENLINTNFIKI